MKQRLTVAAVAFLAMLFVAPNVFSVTVTDMTVLTAQQLVEILVGGGVTVSNVRFTGAPVAAGRFTGGLADGLGIESGIILTTGRITNAIGPNTDDGAGDYNGLAGDPYLDSLVAPEQTFDATVLEFDFIPTESTLSFQYVFASEEYNEFVGSEYNDVFAFLLDGVNIALVPGKAIPVAINNINTGENGKYFKNNSLELGTPPYLTQFDGFTTVLTAQATVTPGAMRHIKLVIADTSDGILDSAVFLAGGTFISGSDLVGSWAAPLVQSCKSTKKGAKCSLKGTFNVSNNGNKDTSSSEVSFYLSDNNTFGGGDILLGSANISAIGPGQSKSVKFSHKFALGQTASQKYVIAVIDEGNSVAESNEGNNIVVFGPVP